MARIAFTWVRTVASETTLLGSDVAHRTAVHELAEHGLLARGEQREPGLESAALLGLLLPAGRSAPRAPRRRGTGKPWLMRRTVERISLSGWDLLRTLRAPLRSASPQRARSVDAVTTTTLAPARTIGVISRTPSPEAAEVEVEQHDAWLQPDDGGQQGLGGPADSGDRQPTDGVALQVEGQLERLREECVVLDDQDLELAAWRWRVA